MLVHPEIPPNTGNVIRLTANTATALHLVEPLGFRMDDRELKRAGLDYHEYATVRVHRDFEPARGARRRGPRRWFAFTTKARRSLYEARFAPGDALVFGCESSGLPDGVLARSRRTRDCASRCARACAASTCRTRSPSRSTRRGGSSDSPECSLAAPAPTFGTRFALNSARRRSAAAAPRRARRRRHRKSACRRDGGGEHAHRGRRLTPSAT